jgi:hypothetical protein
VEDEPSPDDAYMQVSGRLGSQIDLTIEGKYLDTFDSVEEVQEFLTQWTNEHNFFPNLRYSNERGNIEGPIAY